MALYSGAAVGLKLIYTFGGRELAISSIDSPLADGGWHMVMVTSGNTHRGSQLLLWVDFKLVGARQLALPLFAEGGTQLQCHIAERGGGRNRLLGSIHMLTLLHDAAVKSWPLSENPPVSPLLSCLFRREKVHHMSEGMSASRS